MNLEEAAGRNDLFETPKALYVHIPFCSSRCDYCDFHSFALGRCEGGQQSGNEFAESYVATLLHRARELKARLPEPLQTLYIGGGTPTILPDKAFSELLGQLAFLFGSSLKEWTVEANPESLSRQKLSVMADAGVSRLSIGIQSMDDGELETLGRRARRRDNEKALDLAQRSEMQVSADLIAGIPGQSPETLESSVRAILDTCVDHVSLYDLSIEKETELEKKILQGVLKLPAEDGAYSARKHGERILKAAGYQRYEVSNFSPAGRESLHNSVYWSMNSYVGIGSGAVSSLMVKENADPTLLLDIDLGSSEGSAARAAGAVGSLVRTAGGATGDAAGAPACLRMEEGRDLKAYLASPDACLTSAWIDRKDSAFELVMMGLRTRQGVDRQRFARRFGSDLYPLIATVLGKWKDRFIQDDEYLRLDDAGLDLLNPLLLDILEVL